jgi:hypothetical protein
MWAVVFGVHVWPLGSVAASLVRDPGDAGGWGNLLLLAAVMAFCAAKAAGARLLRVRSGWLGAILFLVACGLAHGPEIDPGDPGTYVTVAALTSGSAAVLVMKHRRRLADLVSGLRTGDWRMPLAWVWADEPALIRSAWRVWRLSAAPARAPPARLAF